MISSIDVTVAAIIGSDQRFLFVEEVAGDRIVFNQPAGHLEPGESLTEAVFRETFEEASFSFEPDAFLEFTYGNVTKPIQFSCELRSPVLPSRPSRDQNSMSGSSEFIG